MIGHWSRDHSTRGGPLPMDVPLWPCFYLVPWWKYGTSKVGWTHGRSGDFILCPMQCQC